ncbi:MAG: hypothetical protein KKA73_25515 [Chloroflexi bacterium]|nr:hypothetical protein [Chloroflexota bacterium]
MLDRRAIDDLKTNPALLRDTITADLGEPKTSGTGGRAFWCCPFHGDRTASLVINPNGTTWRCFGCDAGGDVIEWLRLRRGLDFMGAVAALGLDVPGDGGRRQRKPTRTAPKPEPSPIRVAAAPTWHPDAALALVHECQAALWTDAGAKARAWLAGRGIAEATARAWGLGYSDGRPIRGLPVSRGVVIPWLVDGQPWAVKVRRPVPPLPGPKYKHVKGGGSGVLYGQDLLTGAAVAVVCEGELDAVLLWQHAGDLVDVVAVGGATSKPGAGSLAQLAGASRWLVALDRDNAGDKGAAWWGDYSARVRRVRPLQGRDIGEFAQAGGDLRAWVLYHLARLTQGPAEDAERTSPVVAMGPTTAEIPVVDPTGPATWPALPADPCPICGGQRWQRDAALVWACGVCNPQEPETPSSLALPAAAGDG